MFNNGYYAYLRAGDPNNVEVYVNKLGVISLACLARNNGVIQAISVREARRVMALLTEAIDVSEHITAKRKSDALAAVQNEDYEA